jgi:hypothetical protein
MKTRIFGEQKDIVVVESSDKTDIEILAEDAIVKLWFSDGTILGVKYGKHSLLYPNIWHIRILNQGTAVFKYKQCFRETLLYYSDLYEIDAELVNYKVIPRTYYAGDDML